MVIMHTTEQVLHDRINLGRLVNRLEKSMTEDEWPTHAQERGAWLRAQRLIQKCKYARKLLESLEERDQDPSPIISQRYHTIQSTLDRLEQFIGQLDTQLLPPSSLSAPILPKIPPPSLPISLRETEGEALPASASPAQEADLLSSHEPPFSGVSADLLLSPLEAVSSPSRSIISDIPSASLLPTSQPSAPTKSTTTPSFLQNSNAVQQELSEQLAQMAAQLKRNAMHFQEALSADRTVVSEAQEKLETNHDVMKRERVRLRDHRGKSGSTTCLVILSVVVVLISFFIMFFIIRFT